MKELFNRYLPFILLFLTVFLASYLIVTCRNKQVLQQSQKKVDTLLIKKDIKQKAHDSIVPKAYQKIDSIDVSLKPQQNEIKKQVRTRRQLHKELSSIPIHTRKYLDSIAGNFEHEKRVYPNIILSP